MKFFDKNKGNLSRTRAILDIMNGMITKKDTVITNGEEKILVKAENADSAIRELLIPMIDVDNTISVGAATDLPAGTGSQISRGKEPFWHQRAGTMEVVNTLFDRVVPSDNNLFWELGDVENAWTMSKMSPEQDIKINRLKGSKQIARIDLYGDGIKVPFDVMYQKQYYKLEKIIAQGRDETMNLMHKTHMDILKEAGKGNVTAYSAAKTGWTELDRWTDSINQARKAMCKRLLKNNKVRSPLQDDLYLILNSLDEDKWAYAQSNVFIQNKKVPLHSRVKVIFADREIEEGKGILVYPKQMIQNAILIDGEFDIWSRKEDKSVVIGAWSLFGAVVGDTDQVQTITLS